MADDTPTSQPHPHHALDADAVCAQCNEVNPEGTLICRVCGNNLRDQRHQRLQAEAQLMGEDAAGERIRWLPGLLTVLGLLVITYTGLNVERIADWLVDVQRGDDYGDYVWTEPSASLFDAMATNLMNLQPSAEAIYAARYQTDSRATLTGNYVVFFRGTEQYVARAAVSESDEGALFVAVLENGVQLRGRAQFVGQHGLTVDWRHGGGHTETEAFALQGVVTREGDCHFDGTGESTLSDRQFAFEAFCLPDSTSPF